MKRVLSIILSFVLLLWIPTMVYATGEGNIDGGGGSMGGATGHGSWSPGNEGVRVTVVRASDHATVTTPLDLTNKVPPDSIYHFGKVSKLQYNSGVSLSPVKGGYSYIKPAQAIPKIISTNKNKKLV